MTGNAVQFIEVSRNEVQFPVYLDGFQNSVSVMRSHFVILFYSDFTSKCVDKLYLKNEDKFEWKPIEPAEIFIGNDFARFRGGWSSQLGVEAELGKGKSIFKFYI